MLFRKKIQALTALLKKNLHTALLSIVKHQLYIKRWYSFSIKTTSKHSMRSRFLWRYDWLSGFAKCENSTAQVQATLRALRLHHSPTSVLYIWGGGTAAPLPWLIFCAHSSMEKAGWWKRAAALVVDLIPFAAGRNSVKDKWWWKDLSFGVLELVMLW